MPVIVCCCRKHKADFFSVKPKDDKVVSEIICMIESCTSCTALIIEIYRKDCYGRYFDTIRKKNKDAIEYLNSVKIIAKAKEYKEPKGSRNLSWVHCEPSKNYINFVTHDNYKIKSRQMPVPAVNSYSLAS